MKIKHGFLSSLLMPLLMAMMFLTRLPIYGLLNIVFPKSLAQAEWSNQHQGFSVLWYPFVGLLLAVLIVLLVDFLPAATPPLLMAVSVIVLWVLFTGALHLDGLADSVDAAASAHGALTSTHDTFDSIHDESAVNQQREKILMVFKDPAAGPMAVAALILLLLLKVVLLTTMQMPLVWALIIAMVLSRALALVLMVSTPYVRPKGLGSISVANLPKPWVWAVVILCGLLAFLVLPVFHALVLLVLLSLLVLWWRWFWLRAIGGFVGDCVGALIELSEVLVLLVLCLLSF